MEVNHLERGHGGQYKQTLLTYTDVKSKGETSPVTGHGGSPF
jgi:hypothetical protein